MLDYSYYFKYADGPPRTTQPVSPTGLTRSTPPPSLLKGCSP